MATSISDEIKKLNLHPKLRPVKIWSEDGAEETVFMVIGMAIFLLSAIITAHL